MSTNVQTLAPSGDRVVILQDSPEEMSKGGIYIPHEAQVRETIGTVLAVGPGEFYDLYDFGGVAAEAIVRRRPMQYAVGDRVVYSRYAGVDINMGGTVYQVMRQQEIIGILGRADDRDMSLGVGSVATLEGDEAEVA